ncbi:hypothetical protein LCGC14_2641040 [marine sediment metagenome]|uniref:Response regulatory domain-containing protein n=1 Tax=marine sediment metagenome TaxID=412755 RepID=A0A0F9C881_9ZZZZ
MNKKVMIVDDDEHIRLTVKEVLESEGLEVVTAEGALACLIELEKGFTGIVLMDIMMPDYDGWDAIRMIINTGKYKNIIIAMLTAMDKPDQKMQGLQEYVTDYITKPFDSDELVRVIKDYLTYLDG